MDNGLIWNFLPFFENKLSSSCLTTLTGGAQTFAHLLVCNIKKNLNYINICLPITVNSLKNTPKIPRHGSKAKPFSYAGKHRNWGAAGTRDTVRSRAAARYNREHLQATAKHSGASLRVWSRISANSVGDLLRINGVLNAEKYRQMLIHGVIPSGRHIIGPQIYSAAGQWTIFFQSWKCQRGPPRSPDLNIFQCVEDYMKTQKDLRKPTSTDDLGVSSPTYLEQSTRKTVKIPRS